MNCIYFLLILLTNIPLFSFNYDKLINYINKNDVENIEQSLSSNNQDMLKNIFEKKDDFCNTPMLIAAHKNLFDIVELFLDHQNKTGININEFNKNNDTLLHILCKNNAYKMPKNNENTIIDSIYNTDFADCNTTNIELLLGKRTKTDSNQRQINCIKKVLNHQHLNQQNTHNLQNNTPISFAITNNNSEIFKLFIPKLKLAIKNKDITNDELLNMLKTSIVNSNKKAFNLLHNEADFRGINGIELLKLSTANLSLENNNSVEIYKEIINSNKLHINFIDKITAAKNSLTAKSFKEILYPYIKTVLSGNMTKPNQEYYITICETTKLAIELKQDKIYKEFINKYFIGIENIKKTTPKLFNSIKNIVTSLDINSELSSKTAGILSALLFNDNITNNDGYIKDLFNLKLSDSSYRTIAKNMLNSKNFKDLFLIANREDNKHVINEKIFDIIDDDKYQIILNLKEFNMTYFYFDQFSKNYLHGNIENYFYNYMDSSKKIVDFFELIVSRCYEIKEFNNQIIEKILQDNKDNIFVKNLQVTSTTIIRQNANNLEELLSTDEALKILSNLLAVHTNRDPIKHFVDYINNLKNQELEQEQSLEAEEEIVSYAKNTIEGILYSLNSNISDIKNIKNTFHEFIKNKNKEEIENIINNVSVNQSNILDILIVFADMCTAQNNVLEIFVDVQDFIKELINLGGIPKITQESKYYQSIINPCSEIS